MPSAKKQVNILKKLEHERNGIAIARVKILGRGFKTSMSSIFTLYPEGHIKAFGSDMNKTR